MLAGGILGLHAAQERRMPGPLLEQRLAQAVHQHHADPRCRRQLQDILERGDAQDSGCAGENIADAGPPVDRAPPAARAG